MLNGMTRGLGVGPWDDGTTTTPTTPTDTGGTTKPSIGDQIMNWGNTIFNWGSQAGDIYQATQNQPGGSGIPPTTYPGGSSTSGGMSTTKKLLIGVGVLGAAAGGIYLATRKKK